MKKSITLLREANRAYPDLCIENYFDMKTGNRKDGSGDILALFIGTEILELVDEKDSIEKNRSRIVNAIQTATLELELVASAVRP